MTHSVQVLQELMHTEVSSRWRRQKNNEPLGIWRSISSILVQVLASWFSQAAQETTAAINNACVGAQF
jgi:hypothetical protein